MTEGETALDTAHAGIAAASGPATEDAARRAWAGQVLAAELFVWIEQAEGDATAPRLFDLSTGSVVLAFDTEARLAAFAGGAAPYAALSGRALVDWLAGTGAGVGLALNLGAPSAEVLPPDAVDWLAAAAGAQAVPQPGRIAALHAPGVLPEALLSALEGRLARAAGLAQAAWLAEAEDADGSRAPLLVVVGARAGAEGALARAVAGAAAVAGVALDVMFVAPDDGWAKRLARVGLRVDLPAAAAGPVSPGRDPSRPPRLR